MIDHNIRLVHRFIELKLRLSGIIDNPEVKSIRLSELYRLGYPISIQYHNGRFIEPIVGILKAIYCNVKEYTTPCSDFKDHFNEDISIEAIDIFHYSKGLLHIPIKDIIWQMYDNGQPIVYTHASGELWYNRKIFYGDKEGYKEHMGIGEPFNDINALEAPDQPLPNRFVIVCFGYMRYYHDRLAIESIVLKNLDSNKVCTYKFKRLLILNTTHEFDIDKNQEYIPYPIFRLNN